MSVQLIVYQGPDEVLVTTTNNEAKMLATYFDKDTGRDLEDYSRDVVEDEAVRVRSGSLLTDW